MAPTGSGFDSLLCSGSDATGNTTGASANVLAEAITQRIHYHRSKLHELTQVLATEMQRPFVARDIRVLLLLRREESRHTSILNELIGLLR